MIITKSEPFTDKEIESLKKVYKAYIKTVMDIEKKICSAGCNMHYESEKILLEGNSQQKDIWGGGIDLETKEIDFNSFINIRSSQNNPSNEILDPKIRDTYKTLTQFFFKTVL